MSIAVRTETRPEFLEPVVRQKLLDIDSRQPPHHFNTLRGLRAGSIGEDRFLLMVFGVFGVVALVLAVTGVYGIMSYMIVQRKREVGIRLALGANPMELARSIMQQALVMAGTGLAIGLVAAWRMSALVDETLYLIEGNDPAVLGTVGIILLLIAFGAATFPVRRLTKIEPTEALRPE
jgi:ABC-type antimicrobial peptide transport system permease subunit